MKQILFNRVQIMLVMGIGVWNIVAPALAQSSTRIIVGTAVRVRQSHALTAQVITQVNFGTIVQELEKTPHQDTINEESDYWYHIRLPNSQEGWVFGRFTRPFTLAQREPIYHEIAQARFERCAQLTFAEQVDFFRFLGRVLDEVTTREVKAELHLFRVLVLQSSLEPETRDLPGFEAWVQEHHASIGYFEPAGRWSINASLLWALYETYHDLPVADDIAWEAACHSLADDCEGDIACHVSRVNHAEARYLELYPHGKHATTALQWIIRYLRQLTNPRYDEVLRERNEGEDIRARARHEIQQLRQTVHATSEAETPKLLEILQHFEEHYIFPE